MKRVTSTEIRSLILALFDTELREKGLEPETLPVDFDLLAEGAIDSVAVLDMIAAVEDHVGGEIDFEKLDEDHLTVIGKFSEFVSAESARSAPDESPTEARAPHG